MTCELCETELMHAQIGEHAGCHGRSVDFAFEWEPKVIRSVLNWDEELLRLYSEEEVLCFLRQRWGDRLRLELGAGKRNKDGPPWGKYPWATIGLNRFSDPNCDIYRNLDRSYMRNPGKDMLRFVIPLPDECIAEIHANQFFEHIRNIIPLMNDCYRVLVPGGFMNIHVPYYLGPDADSDPTHVRRFSENSFRYYCRREDGTQFVQRFSDYEITSMFDLEKNEHNNVGMSVVLRKPVNG